MNANFSIVETSKETKINKTLTEWRRKRHPKEPLRRNFRNETSAPSYCFKHSRVTLLFILFIPIYLTLTVSCCT